MSRKKKKKAGDPDVILWRAMVIGGGAFALLMVAYVAAFFMLTEMRVTQNQFLRFNTRVCPNEFVRQFFRPLTFIEKRVTLDYEVVVRDGTQPVAAEGVRVESKQQ